MSGPDETVPFAHQKKGVVLCEGPHDRAFCRALFDHYIIGDFCTVDPLRLGIKGGGHTRWPEAIQAICAATDFSIVQKFLIIGDKDDDKLDRLTRIKDAINETSLSNGRMLACPENEFEWAGQQPKMAIILLPIIENTGNLESLLIPSAKAKLDDATKECIDKFANCAGWAQSKHSKAYLRAIISCAHRKNPELTFAKIWTDMPGIFDPAHQDFSALGNFLRDAQSSF